MPQIVVPYQADLLRVVALWLTKMRADTFWPVMSGRLMPSLQPVWREIPVCQPHLPLRPVRKQRPQSQVLLTTTRRSLVTGWEAVPKVD